MTVKELIEKLKEMPENWPIKMDVCDEDMYRDTVDIDGVVRCVLMALRSFGLFQWILN